MHSSTACPYVQTHRSWKLPKFPVKNMSSTILFPAPFPTRRNKGIPPNPTWASPTLGCHGCSTSQNPSALPKGPKNPGTGPATPSPPAKPQVDSPITVRSLHVAQTSHVPVRRVDDARAWTGRAASGSRARPRRWALPRTLRPTVWLVSADRREVWWKLPLHK